MQHKWAEDVYPYIIYYLSPVTVHIGQYEYVHVCVYLLLQECIKLIKNSSKDFVVQSIMFSTELLHQLKKKKRKS